MQPCLLKYLPQITAVLIASGVGIKGAGKASAASAASAASFLVLAVSDFLCLAFTGELYHNRGCKVCTPPLNAGSSRRAFASPEPFLLLSLSDSSARSSSSESDGCGIALLAQGSSLAAQLLVP